MPRDSLRSASCATWSPRCNEQLHRPSARIVVMDSGFAIVPGIFGATELDGIARELASASLRRSRAGVRHLLSIPAVATLSQDQRLIGLAARVLGGRPVPFSATLFDKSPEANWLVAWHQDTALPLLERRDAEGWGPWSEKDGVLYAHAPAMALSQVVAIRIHLDDSTSENGPLRVLPGTHELGVLSDREIRAVAERVEPVTCTVGRGGLIIIRPLLLHASSKVVAAASRTVIHLQYAASSGFDQGLQLRAA